MPYAYRFNYFDSMTEFWMSRCLVHQHPRGVNAIRASAIQ